MEDTEIGRKARAPRQGGELGRQGLGFESP
jgi:hypothetical protein